jgi:hypothetical protein
MAGGVMPAGHFLASAAAKNPVKMFEVSAIEEEYLFALIPRLRPGDFQ